MTADPDLPAPGAVTEHISEALDPDEFTPRLISLLSNKLVWRESSMLRARFGLGTNDWRVVSALGMQPGMTASRISEFLALNQAIVSKSVTTLIERGHVVAADVRGRRRPLYLTASGAALHHEMLPISLSGQEIILADMPAEEVRALNATLRTLLERFEAAEDAESLSELEKDVS